MELHFNVTGDDRKRLVGVIEKATGQKAAYLRMPTCAYQVGDYNVDKDGTLTFPDSTGISSVSDVIDACVMAGFEPEGWERNTEEQPEENVSLTVEMPRGQFTETQLENLKKLVSSKESLLKQALGTEEVPVIVTEEKVSFPWFSEGIPVEDCMAYTKLIGAICRMAKEAKRVTSKEKETDNPKYAFRCFLLRLGFIGNEYKADRKILLRNLSGSSAFKDSTVGRRTT